MASFFEAVAIFPTLSWIQAYMVLVPSPGVSHCHADEDEAGPVLQLIQPKVSSAGLVLLGVSMILSPVLQLAGLWYGVSELVKFVVTASSSKRVIFGVVGMALVRIMVWLSGVVEIFPAASFNQI